VTDITQRPRANTGICNGVAGHLALGAKSMRSIGSKPFKQRAF